MTRTERAVTCSYPSGGVPQLQLRGIGHMQSTLLDRTQLQVARWGSHNVAADDEQLQIKLRGRGESAIAQHSRWQPP